MPGRVRSIGVLAGFALVAWLAAAPAFAAVELYGRTQAEVNNTSQVPVSNCAASGADCGRGAISALAGNNEREAAVAAAQDRAIARPALPKPVVHEEPCL